MSKDVLNIEIISYESQPVVYRVSNSKSIIGAMLVMVNLTKDGKVSHVEVLHIYIERKYRGKGYAQQLVGDLQKSFRCIVTGWLGSEPAGRSLFLKMGFLVKKSLNKRYPDALEWRREEPWS